jgi:hypothetical protein
LWKLPTFGFWILLKIGGRQIHLMHKNVWIVLAKPFYRCFGFGNLDDKAKAIKKMGIFHNCEKILVAVEYSLFACEFPEEPEDGEVILGGLCFQQISHTGLYHRVYSLCFLRLYRKPF